MGTTAQRVAMRRTRKTAALVVIGTALAVPGSAMTAGPARAACAQWTYTGNFSIHQDNGLRVDITKWSGTSAGSAQAALFLADGTPAQINTAGDPVQHGNHSPFGAFTSQQVGPVTGGIKGNQMDFTVAWQLLKVPVSNHYTATIADDGQSANGLSVNTQNAQNKWNTFATFTCAAQQAPPPPVAPAPPAPAQAPAAPPAAAAPTTATVISDVNVYQSVSPNTGGTKKLGVLRSGSKVQLIGSCKSKDWCHVSGDAVPTGQGWVWGALKL